jgi:hypothetical protein
MPTKTWPVNDSRPDMGRNSATSHDGLQDALILCDADQKEEPRMGSRPHPCRNIFGLRCYINKLFIQHEG